MKDQTIEALRLEARANSGKSQSSSQGFLAGALARRTAKQSLQLREREMALLERGVALAALQNKSQPIPETYTSLSRELATSEAVSVKASSKKIKWMIAIAALFMISLLKGPQPQVPAQTSKAAAPATEVVCKFDDPHCVGEQYYLEAAPGCANAVQSQAKYDMRWTSSWVDRKFTQFTWGGDSSHKTITYGGDHVQFQNGFGAWQTMSYFCTYDPALKMIVDIAVR